MTERTALVLRHVAYEGLAGFAAPITAAGYAIEHRDVAGAALEADVQAADLLIVMGGPMGVYQTDAHPWLAHEVAAIRRRLDLRRPTLGICLGAQLVAAALGASVHPGPVKEVGFAPLTLSEAGRASPLARLDGVPLLHWHGDTFDLPPGVERLASTPAYRNQAFRAGDWLLGLQCHPEMGDADDRFAEWLDGSDAYLAEAGTGASALVADHSECGPAAADAGRAMLAAWLAALPK